MAALAHGNRGMMLTNAVDEETRHVAVTLARERYVRFNRMHANEKRSGRCRSSCLSDDPRVVSRYPTVG